MCKILVVKMRDNVILNFSELYKKSLYKKKLFLKLEKFQDNTFEFHLHPISRKWYMYDFDNDSNIHLCYDEIDAIETFLNS